MGCHFLLQGIFLTPGIELWSPALQTDSLPSEPPGWEVKDSQIEGTLISTPSQHWPGRHPDSAIDSPFCGQNSWEAVILLGSRTLRYRMRVGASKGDPVSRDLLEKDPGVRKSGSIIKFGWGLAQVVGWHYRLNGHEFELVMDREACVFQSMGLQRVPHD